MITISSIKDKSDCARFDELCSLLPRVAPLFDLELVKRNFDALEIKRDGSTIGVCLYKVFPVDGKSIFYVGGLGVESGSESCADFVYEWLIKEASSMDCDFFVFDSARKGAVKFAREHDLICCNVQYFKPLKGGK